MKVAIAAISLLFSLAANAAAVSVALIKLFDSHYESPFWFNRYPTQQTLVLALMMIHLL